ncbi:prolactin-inducible protein [Puma concolor]|uniref:Prolactin-induced protein n=1 Tax=Puma concolor TaxID=9696 RepID=A0A6P6IA48_PUMCO|nr:prolactin-inducible protein [Puma concolor]
MHFLQLLFRASSAALLLVLCLQLGTNKAQENTGRKVIKMEVQMPRRANASEEITVKMNVKTELRECMVITSYLRSNITIEGPFNYRFTACLCKNAPRNFYWDFHINETAKIVAVAQVTAQLGICPNNEAVVPLEPKYIYTIGTITVG